MAANVCNVSFYIIYKEISWSILTTNDLRINYVLFEEWKKKTFDPKQSTPHLHVDQSKNTCVRFIYLLELCWTLPCVRYKDDDNGVVNSLMHKFLSLTGPIIDIYILLEQFHLSAMLSLVLLSDWTTEKIHRK